MGRGYKRRTEKSDDGYLRRAILAVQSGIQIRAAARTFGVDHTRIIRQIKINPNVSAKCDQIEAWPKFKEEVDIRTAKH